MMANEDPDDRAILIVENYPNRADCITRLLKQFGIRFEVVPAGDIKLPLSSHICGVILTGGPQSVTTMHRDDTSVLRPVFNLLDEVQKTTLPLLGICLGHQLLAAWVGGSIKTLAPMIIGFRSIEICEPDRIFDCYPNRTLVAFQYHHDHVVELPAACNVLARSETCAIEAFRIEGESMWAVQFHPEVTSSDGEAIMRHGTPPLEPWMADSDVQSPYLLHSFASSAGVISTTLKP